jgi:hypothetical protein
MISIMIIRHLYLNSMQYMLIKSNFFFQKLRQDGLILLICLLFSKINCQDSNNVLLVASIHLVISLFLADGASSRVSASPTT